MARSTHITGLLATFLKAIISGNEHKDSSHLLNESWLEQNQAEKN